MKGFCHNLDCNVYGNVQYTSAGNCISCGSALYHFGVAGCPMCNTEKLVRESANKPKQKIFVGMMRPPWEEALSAITKDKMGCPGCSERLMCPYSIYGAEGKQVGYDKLTAKIREHWQLGHFDTPVYKEVE